MGKFEDRIVYIDGYAGPGSYAEGEEGSPIIALRKAMNYLASCSKHGWKRPEIICLFVENDRSRFDALVSRLNGMHLPSEIRVIPANSTFETVASDVLNLVSQQNARLAPTFAFVDPFGYNLSFDLIAQLMRQPKCEVFINFMYEFINFDNGSLFVDRTLTWQEGKYTFNPPKSESRVRLITLLGEVVLALRAHRLEQNKQRLILGEA